MTMESESISSSAPSSPTPSLLPAEKTAAANTPHPRRHTMTFGFRLHTLGMHLECVHQLELVIWCFINQAV